MGSAGVVPAAPSRGPDSGSQSSGDRGCPCPRPLEVGSHSTASGVQLWPLAGFAIQGAGGGWALSRTPWDPSLLRMVVPVQPKGAHLGRRAGHAGDAGNRHSCPET